MNGFLKNVLYLWGVDWLFVPVKDFDLDLVNVVQDELLALWVGVSGHLQGVGPGHANGHALHDLALGVLDENLKIKWIEEKMGALWSMF